MRGDDSISRSKDSSKVESLSRTILDYLEKYPEAGDTLEGIAAWWLQKQRIEHLVDEVAEALELLAEKGTVTIHKTPGGTSFYKIKKK